MGLNRTGLVWGITALMEVVSAALSASLELISLVWMEISMFAVAALVYMLCVGGASVQRVSTNHVLIFDCFLRKTIGLGNFMTPFFLLFIFN